MDPWRRRALLLGMVLTLAGLGCWKAQLTVSTSGIDEEFPELGPGQTVPVQRLAHEIDVLERHIETFGSIVPKRADVWGQARLTLHRQEFEREMLNELTQFNESLQGYISRRDQAFLANAFSLQAVMQSGAAVSVTNTAQGLISDPIKEKDSGIIRKEGTLSGVFKPPGFTDASKTTLPISIEPTLRLNQKARYLNHLHQLRRINEGDDNADAPGYALNLVRIPVSILTGNHTERGYGAEMTVTARPHLTDDLLPSTFRNLVIQDLVELGTVPLSHGIGAFDLPENPQKPDETDLIAIIQAVEVVDEAMLIALSTLRTTVPSVGIGELRAKLARVASESVSESKTNKALQAIPQAERDQRRERLLKEVMAPMWSKADQERRDGPAADKNPIQPPTLQRMAEILSVGNTATNKIEEARKLLAGKLSAAKTNVPVRQRGTRAPMPQSQLPEVFDLEQIARVMGVVYRGVKDHIVQNRPYHLDVRAVLNDEFSAAYEFLSQEQHLPLWDRFCTSEMARAIRTRDEPAISRLRADFLNAVAAAYPKEEPTLIPLVYFGDQVALKPTTVFAWGILVETALLEEQLHDDMKRVAIAHGGPAVPDEVHFHGPNPSPEACKLFNEYVAARWPVYVFALDPVTEDQNIADDFSMRREMQLAIALAFSSGQINASTMTRFVRRIEKDMDTIALNRTVIAFSHGDNTFGWRFYPRMQTPPIKGNLNAVAELINPNDDLRRDLRNRRLENGQRECVALMVMPSFVPYMNLEICSHWFNLNNPKIRDWTLKDAMRMSRRVQCLQGAAANPGDAKCYRPGDVAMLNERLGQLSLRLPFQHQQVSVPYENTTGGFRLFASGITDLSPDLIGWYGAPGIDPTRETTLFLVGDNFSVDQTRVVVGGLKLEGGSDLKVKVKTSEKGVTVESAEPGRAVEIISRQILRVSIPAHALPYLNKTNKDQVIDVHVATPYGVTRHLTVPMYFRPTGDVVNPKGNAGKPIPAPAPTKPPPVSPPQEEQPAQAARTEPSAGTTAPARPSTIVPVERPTPELRLPEVLPEPPPLPPSIRSTLPPSGNGQ